MKTVYKKRNVIDFAFGIQLIKKVIVNLFRIKKQQFSIREERKEQMKENSTEEKRQPSIRRLPFFFESYGQL